MSYTKKIVAGFVTVAFAASLVATPVAAQTQSVAELTAQINSLLATIASLQSQLSGMQGGTTTTGSVTITMDLTMGSTGSQVVALQDFLVAKGHLVMPAGVAKGTFGALTRAAVIKYQLAKGITPAAGYVGAKTRAAMNAEGGVTTPGTGTPTTGTPSEGQLDNEDQVGSIAGEDLEEGDEDVEVLGLEFDAEDSAMTIDRVDVEFEATTVSGSDNLDDYVTEVSLMLDGKVLATADADDFDEDNEVYSHRFTGLKGMVAEGKTGRLTVAVSAVDNVDTGDDSTWTVTFPIDAIRATDTKGISDTYFIAKYDETFSFDEATGGDLEVSEASDNMESTDVEVDDEDETEDVELLSFDLEANSGDVLVQEIPVQLGVTGATDVDAVVNAVKLYQGSTLLATESVNSTGTAVTVYFDDLDIDVSEDDEETLTVKVDVNDIEAGAFDEGDAVRAVVLSTAIDAEDEFDDTISMTSESNITGEYMYFRTVGIDVEFVKSSQTKTTPDGTGADDEGTFTVEFKVTAFGEDIYVRDAVTATTSSAAQVAAAATSTMDGVVFRVNPTASVAVAGVSGDLGSTADLQTNSWLVEEGQTETFTLTVSATSTASAFVNVEMLGLEWSESDSSTLTNLYTANLDDFETAQIELRVR